MWITHRFRISGKLFCQMNEEVWTVEAFDETQGGILSAAVKLCGDDGHRCNSVELLQQLEAI